jgi:endonuclease-3
MHEATVSDIENIIRKIGLYKNKAKNIKGITELLIEKYDGQVLPERQMLESLPGVGRKTANVVLSVAFDIPAFAVDTHVERVSKRLKLAYEKDNVKIVEQKLMKKFDKSKWNKLHHQFIFFGRYFCTARNPNCKSCRLLNICKNGRKYIENK